jgi:hypothetical protein
MPERKSGSQAVTAKVSPVPSKRSYSVRLDDDLLAQLRDSPKADVSKSAKLYVTFRRISGVRTSIRELAFAIWRRRAAVITSTNAA